MSARTWAACGLLLLAAAAAGAKDDGPPPTTVTWSAPLEWRREKPREGEFAAWQLRDAPKVEHPRKPARLALYRLGKARVRTLEQRTAAWAARFLGPKGERLEAKAAKVKRLELEGLEAAHLVWVEGAYVAPLDPGAEPRPPLADWVGLYARVVGPDGEWVCALIGPHAEVVPWSKAFQAFVAAARPGRAPREPDPREARKSAEPPPGDEGEGEKTE
ncbi:MAG: hypothetical protein AB7N76_22820 [Planctomycetota bacterium]